MELDLRGRTAYVSGGTEGIGRGIVEALAAEGVHIFVAARSRDRLAGLAEDITRRFGVDCAWAAADFSVAGQAGRSAEAALTSFGTVDIVINNAGRSLPLPLDAPAGEWHAGFQLNFLSHLEVILALAPGMRHRRWGRIVNIMGVSFRSPRKVSAGTPAKFALLATSKALAAELAEDEVTINAVGVGKIESTQINEMYYTDAADRAAFAAAEIPLRRFGAPADVAHAVTFLASSAASYITGSVLTVDGGLNKFVF